MFLYDAHYIDSFSHSFELLLYFSSPGTFYNKKAMYCIGNQSQSDRILYEVICECFYPSIVKSTVSYSWNRCETKAENEEMNRIQGIMSYLLED